MQPIDYRNDEIWIPQFMEYLVRASMGRELWRVVSS
jgi:hypothetical protein